MSTNIITTAAATSPEGTITSPSRRALLSSGTTECSSSCLRSHAS